MANNDDTTLLARYHTRPGRTVAMLEPFRDAAGRSSYELLASEVEEAPRDTRVLDLACGDGYLLGLLATRGFTRLVGIDRSPEELAAAHARLGRRAAILGADAGALPLPDGSVGLVLCHMALMLLSPSDTVLADIARVLAPGRPLVAVTNRYHADPAFAAFSRELRRITAEAGMERLRLGAPDLFTVDGLRARLRRARFDEPRLQIQDFVIRVRTTPRGLWPIFESMYDVFRLPDDAKVALQRALLLAWDALAGADGHLDAAMGMRLFRCPVPEDARTP